LAGQLWNLNVDLIEIKTTLKCVGTRLSIMQIATQICKAYEIDIKDVMGKSRLQDIVEARHAVMYVCALAGYSCAAIGRRMNRNHSTVISGCKAYERKLREGGSLQSPIYILDISRGLVSVANDDATQIGRADKASGLVGQPRRPDRP
jgi:chromosomal replication initiation ATPase DnaA